MDQEALLKDAGQHIAALKAKRAPIESLVKAAAVVLFSVNPDLTNGKTVQVSINNELYDGSGQQCLKVWRAGLVGNTCDRDGDWLHLRFRDDRLNNLPGVSDFQASEEDVAYSMMDQSNFYEVLYDFAGVAGWTGTAVFWISEDELKKTITLNLLQPLSFCIDESASGEVNVLHREFWLTASEILQTWPGVPKEFRQKLEQDLYAEHSIEQLVRPRKEYDPEDLGHKNFPYQNLYMADGRKILLEESGFEDFPFYCFRPERIGGSPWGSCPAFNALRDAQIIQAVAETMLLLDQKLADAPLQAPESLRAEGIQTHPGGITWLPDQDLGKISPLYEGINRGVGMDREAILRRGLEQHFNVDTFLTQSRSETAKTATEVMGIQNEQSAILTPLFSSLTSQGLDPFIQRVRKIARKFGLVPPAPAALAQVKGADLDVIYVGPAATLRKRFRAQSGVMNLSDTVIKLTQAFPTLQQDFAIAANPDRLMEMAFEGNNVQTALNDQDTRDKKRDQLKQAAVAQAQAQAGLAAMQAQGGGQ